MTVSSYVLNTRTYLTDTTPPAALEDVSRRKNNGTFSAPPPTWVRNAQGIWVLNYDGVNNYVTLSTNPELLRVGKFTLLTWVKYVSLVGNKWIMGTGNSGTPSGYMLATSGANPRMLFRDSVSFKDKAATNITMSNNVWYLQAMVLDGANAYLYVNGVLGTGYAPAYTPPITAGASAFRLGFLIEGINKFAGQLWKTRLVLKPLTQADLFALYMSERRWLGV
ncbi:MAG: LamG-like jellyroll fold domain-containing protein [Chloroflexota bacterium]